MRTILTTPYLLPCISPRILSAWFYRCHTPNDDCFNVRAYFKSIRAGLIPKVTYAEYIEMPEYSNIQSRMLGADSFPYRNVTVDDEVCCIALLSSVCIYNGVKACKIHYCACACHIITYLYTYTSGV